MGGPAAVLAATAPRHPPRLPSRLLLVRGPDTNPELVLIDFGLSSLEGGAEDKGVDLYFLERALLSTHPGTEQLFSQICDAYSQQGGKQAREVLAKFEEIRRRGRKRTMVG